MKITNYIFLFCLVVLFSCQNDLESEKQYAGAPFVRFNLMVDDGVPVYNSDVVSGYTVATDHYTNRSLITSKIPVALTYTNLQEPVQVDYEVTSTGYSDFMVSPASLSFGPGQLTDTIVVQWNSAWEVTDAASLTLELSGASDVSVLLGAPNETNRNNSLTIDLGEPVARTVNFGASQLVVSGEEGEEIYFDVEFPGGYLPEDVEGAVLVVPTSSDFNFNLELVDQAEDRSSFTYRFTVLEDLTAEQAEFVVTLGFSPDLGLEAQGQTSLEIVREESFDRDPSTNIAAQFYDLSNQYYQTQFYMWLERSGECTWYRARCFVVPVEVDADDANAVFDPATGRYYHAFKVAFRSTTANVINVLAMQRWFSSGLSRSLTNSPGMNEIDLEFLPADGNNLLEGEVFIKNRDYVVGSTSGISYPIRMSGNGTYRAVSENYGTEENPQYDYDVEFELTISNSDVFGEVRTAHFYLSNYSKSREDYPDNAGGTVSSYWPIPESPCFVPVDLN